MKGYLADSDPGVTDLTLMRVARDRCFGFIGRDGVMFTPEEKAHLNEVRDRLCAQLVTDINLRRMSVLVEPPTPFGEDYLD